MVFLIKPAVTEFRLMQENFDWIADKLGIKDKWENVGRDPRYVFHYCRLREYPFVLGLIKTIYGNDAKNKSILDIGSDYGFISLLLKKGFKDITVHKIPEDYSHITDIITWNLDDKKIWYSFLHILSEYKVKMCVGLLEDLPLKENSYDIITNISVLEHIPGQMGKARLFSHISKCWEVLKPGGVLIVTMDYLVGKPKDCGGPISNVDVKELLDICSPSEWIFGRKEELLGFDEFDLSYRYHVDFIDNYVFAGDIVKLCISSFAWRKL